MGFPLSTSPCRAPGWVGSTPAENIIYCMALSKSSKRPHLDTDSDSETLSLSFPHFVVLESLEDKQLAKLSPFVIEKTISGIVKPISVKKLKDGTLLIEVEKKTYADNLIKMKSFHGLKIKGYAHTSLNTSKGVVRSSELSLCSLEEIKTHLQNQGVSDVKRITIKRNDEIINTNTYIFTFNRSQAPTELKVGYNIIKVNPYIPNPLRCYNCQKFGHHESKCLKSPICKKSGGSGSDHAELTCTNPICCANCQSSHPADSKECMVWKLEKQVNTIKYTNNIPFPEARKIVQSQTQPQTKSYSQVTKSNIETKPSHSCHSCSTILEKLVSLTPDNLPQLITELKSSLSEKNHPTITTSKPTVSTASSQPPAVSITPSPPPSEMAPHVPSPREIHPPKSPVRQDNRSPSRGLRQSPTPRQRIQLEKTNSKNRFEVLESEQSMECGEISSTPTPTSKTSGQKPPQTPKPQRTKYK